MKYVLTYFFAALGLNALAQSAEEIRQATKNRDKYLFAVKTEPAKFDAAVSAEYANDILIVPVEINGKIRTFMFDSGAVTILSPELITELGLQPVTSNKFVDSAGNLIETNFFMVPEIKFGPVKFRNVGVGSFDLTKFGGLLCHRLDGVLGSNMMRVCNWEIEYGKMTIRMSSDKISMADSEKISFTENFSGTPRVKIETSGINFIAEVDTGNNGSLDIPQEFFDKSRLGKSGKIATCYGRNSHSFLSNAEQLEHLVLADSVYIGKNPLRRRIRISPSPMVLIGNDFFSAMGKFAINYKNGELLVPKKKSAPKAEYSFGFSPARENGKTVVAVVWKDSPAEKVGIGLNDEVVSLNGIVLESLADSDWCSLRQKLIEQTELHAVVRKADGTQVEARLGRYDLLE